MPNERDVAMASMYRSGKTQQEIADFYGVTDTTVRHALKRQGVSRNEGGINLLVRTRLENKKKKDDARHLAIYGITKEEVDAYREIGRIQIANGVRRDDTDIGSFMRRRQAAKDAGKAWNITFPQWLEIRRFKAENETRISDDVCRSELRQERIRSVTLSDNRNFGFCWVAQ